jgi:beta-aspartyl-peptidase (threonine type)
LDIFGNPAIYLTCYEAAQEIDFVISNIYAKDQIAITYLGKAEKVRIIMNAGGIFKEKINELMANFQKANIILTFIDSLGCVCIFF